jgi:hypothetical protein
MNHIDLIHAIGLDMPEEAAKLVAQAQAGTAALLAVGRVGKISGERQFAATSHGSQAL